MRARAKAPDRWGECENVTVINICFHGIGTPKRTLEPDEDRYWISEDLFSRILGEVAERPDVRLSFDDGNVSDIEVGLERLLEYRRTATFFVLAGRLDQPGSLATSDVRELRRQGMVIGSHGMDHVPWRYMPNDQVERELVDAKELLSQAVGAPVEQAALPLGRYDRAVLTHLRRLGYHRVFSSDRRRTREQSWLQPRFSVHADDTIDSIRSNVLAPQPAVRRARSALVGVVKRLR